MTQFDLVSQALRARFLLGWGYIRKCQMYKKSQFIDQYAAGFGTGFGVGIDSYVREDSTDKQSYVTGGRR